MKMIVDQLKNKHTKIAVNSTKEFSKPTSKEMSGKSDHKMMTL